VLWFLRHAEAAEGSPDAERPLTERGRRDATAAGSALAVVGAPLEVCLTSPKRRAVETARLACEALGVEVVVEPALGGGPFDPKEVAAGLEDALLVGHDPDFSLAVHRLTGAQVRLRKGGLAGVDRGELAALFRPADLAAVGG
jgi:phosphohistidine phosphatase